MICVCVGCAMCGLLISPIRLRRRLGACARLEARYLSTPVEVKSCYGYAYYGYASWLCVMATLTMAMLTMAHEHSRGVEVLCGHRHAGLVPSAYNSEYIAMLSSRYRYKYFAYLNTIY